jgi:hypothetical protein
VGDESGELTYIENTGTSTVPVFVKMTGSANPFNGVEVSFDSRPAFGDLVAASDRDHNTPPRSQTRNFTQASSPPIFKGNVVHQIVRPVRHLQLQPVQVGREHQLTPQPRIVPRFMC